MPISDAESLVMDVLWNEHPLSAEEVVAALAKSTDWQEPTIKTLLNRLLNKGAIEAERDGRRYLYRPLLSRADYVHAESKSLLDRLFDGHRVAAHEVPLRLVAGLQADMRHDRHHVRPLPGPQRGNANASESRARSRSVLCESR